MLFSAINTSRFLLYNLMLFSAINTSRFLLYNLKLMSYFFIFALSFTFQQYISGRKKGQKGM